jgi:hypothetical protein
MVQQTTAKGARNARRTTGLQGGEGAVKALTCHSVAAGLLLAAAVAQAEPEFGRFDPAVPALTPPWQLVRLEKHVPATEFRSVRWDGVDAIEARADASMALLGRPVEVDLARQPVLCWRWRVDGVVKSADMSRRNGDDYAARVYLAFQMPPGALGLADRAALAMARAVYGKIVPDAAINYVWDNRHPVGTVMPNAYTDRARMIVRRSGDAQAGGWVEERVNVRADAGRQFGSDRMTLKFVALASDADNTGERARAGFADLHFVAEDQACDYGRERRAARGAAGGG